MTLKQKNNFNKIFKLHRLSPILFLILIALSVRCHAKNNSATKPVHQTLATHHHEPVIQKQAAPNHFHTPEKRSLKAPIAYPSLPDTKHPTVQFVKKTIERISYSIYKFGGTRFDFHRGIFILDCSSYVDRILKAVHPRAFASIVKWSGSLKPTTRDYYHFFNNLRDEHHYWSIVDDIKALKPGDIIVFRYKNDCGLTKGHIMIVMNKAVKNKQNVFKVRIADSAPFAHSYDTRSRHDSGIGIGTLLLKVDPKTYQPSDYAWSIGSSWKKIMNFAMARPVGFS